MIRRLLHVRLRLVDAVALAALAVLGLKVAALLRAPPPTEAAFPANGVVAPGDQLPSFAKVLAHARSNYVPPDVVMTGAVPPKDGKKDEKPSNSSPADPPKAKPAAADLAAPPSPSERALLERLGERRDELQQRSRDTDMRERLLENAEKKLEARINELKAIEEKAQEAAGKRGDSEAAGFRNLITMYEAMKPKDAARVFDRLPHDVLVPVVVQMNPRKMAEVLAVMAPEAAEKLTVALATRARKPGGDAPAQPAPALPPNELPALEPPVQRPAR